MNDHNEIPNADIHEAMNEVRKTRYSRDPPPADYPLKKKLVLAVAGATLAVGLMLFVNFFQNGITQERMKAVALADIIPSEPLPGDEELFDEEDVPEGEPRPSFFYWWYSTFGRQPAPTPVPSPNFRLPLSPPATTAPTPIAIPTPIPPAVVSTVVVLPTVTPTQRPTPEPTQEPTQEQTQEPTQEPTPVPSSADVPSPIPTTPAILDLAALQQMVDETASGGSLIFNEDVNLNGGTLQFMRGITFEGTGTLSNGYIKATGITGLTIRGLTFQGVQIGLFTTRNTTIEQCELVDWHPSAFTGNVGGLIAVNGNTSGLTIQNNTIRDVYYITARAGEDAFGASDPASTYGCGIKIETSDSTLSNIRIIGNRISRTHGPSAIWIGGGRNTFTNLYIMNNHIFDTVNNGIAFVWYETDTSTGAMFSSTLVSGNTIENIGGIRQKDREGRGGSGIYANGNAEGIQIVGNTIDTVLEVGIGGWYGLVQDNTIRNTGADQLHHPTEDTAGIDGGGPFVIGNTIINPGRDGGLYYASDSLPGPTLYRNNVIRNASSAWKPSTTYAFGTRVYSGTNWYVCVEGGTSSTTGPSGTTAGIADGSCTWDWQKPLALKGIDLNVFSGLQQVSFEGNTVENMATAFASSGFLHGITIKDNRFIGAASTSNFFGGYGQRMGEDFLATGLDNTTTMMYKSVSGTIITSGQKTAAITAKAGLYTIRADINRAYGATFMFFDAARENVYLGDIGISPGTGATLVGGIFELTSDASLMVQVLPVVGNTSVSVQNLVVERVPYMP